MERNGKGIGGREGHRVPGPITVSPPNPCTENRAHNAVGERVHAGVNAAEDDGEGVKYEDRGDDGKGLSGEHI